MRKVVVFAALALCAAQSFAAPKFPFKRGTNCRGLDVSPYSSSQYNTSYYGLDNTYTDIKAKGFDFVRFSVDLTRYYDSDNDRLYTSGSYNIETIDLIMQRFLDAGLSVHLLMGRFKGVDIDLSNEDERAFFKKVWRRVAERYSSWSDKVAFELLNEPRTSVLLDKGMSLPEAADSLNSLLKETVDVIRESNPTRYILWPLAEVSCCYVLTWGNFRLVDLPKNDPYIAVVVHNYEPTEFTHQGAGYAFNAPSVPLTDAHRLALRNELNHISQFAEAFPDVPIVLNEFGVMSGKSDPSDAHEWMSTVREFIEGNDNMAWGHFEYTDLSNYIKAFAMRGSPSDPNSWRTNVVDAFFPKGWDDKPSTYGQLDFTKFSKKLQVSFPGYAGSETLMDFPVLVKLSRSISGFSYDDFLQKSTGGDLRFADSDGRHIPHEIDTWNPNGVSTVWVRVPSLNAGTKIYACYGCADPAPATAMDVWDDDYVGVWHLNEGGLPLRESSRRSTSFTLRNGQGISFASEGVVGGSVAFNGSPSNAVLAADHDNLDGFEKFTIETWTKQSSHKANAGIIGKRMGYNDRSSYYLYDNGSSTVLCATETGKSLAIQAGIASPAVDGSWAHQACSVDTTVSTGNVKGYLNGGVSSTTSKSCGRIYSGIGWLALGNLNPDGKDNAFNGSIDEVRISKCVRSADWIKATHDTVAKADFATYSFGDEPPPEPERTLYVTVEGSTTTNTLDAALVTEYITNIVKQGAGTLIASGLTNYVGDITLEEGVFNVGVTHGLGKHGYANNIYVGPNASLHFSGGVNDIFNNKKIVFEGAGASAAPLSAKFFNTNSKWVTIGVGMSFTFKTDTKFAVGCWNRMILKNVDVDMQGHNLTLSCSPGNQVEFSGSTFRNPGNIIAAQGMAFYEGTGNNTFTGTGEIRLRDNSSYLGNGTVSASGWTIVATNSNTKIAGYSNKFPTASTSGEWNGKIVFGRHSASFCHFTGGSGNTVLSNTVFNVKGPMSGSAPLKVGPGWLNLHTSAASNTCSGAVTVTGRTPSNLTPGYPILAGGGGIGLWNGAACFPNASSITFTNTARLAFMDNTACTVPNVKFIALAGETQSISGGVHTARSTMAGFVKEGAGTLLVDSPVSVTGLGDVKGGTLKVAYRSDTSAQTQEAMLEPMPQFAGLRFASGTTLDLSDNVGMVLSDLEGAPAVTNSGMFGISGKWKLVAPGGKLDIVGQNAMGGQAAGVLCFLPGATFDLADEAAFKAAVAAAGPDGLLVAEANWILDPSNEQLQGNVALPSPAQSLGAGWSMSIGKGRGDDFAGRGLYLRYSDPSASGYAAWIAGKGITGTAAAADKVTNGIANGVRYAFDIDPATSEIGTPIIQVVRDAAGNPSVQSRDLATGRDDVTFGVLATPDLTDWSNAKLVPMTKFATDGLWKPAASESSTYVFPTKMFFKYTVEVK